MVRSQCPTGEGRQARLFARIAVDDETWTMFRAIALQREVTLARAVGMLVEGSARPAAEPAEVPRPVPR